MGHFKDKHKIELRKRNGQLEIHPPMNFNKTSDQSRINEVKNRLFDHEGFNFNYFVNFF